MLLINRRGAPQQTDASAGKTWKPSGTPARLFVREDTLMKSQLTAMLDGMLRPRAARAGEAMPGNRHLGPSIAQIIAALDDRDTRNALELLDPPPASAMAPERRMKCAGGCGE
jgi:hypothetical protein